VNTFIEQLVDSLLYEGYALYPYTPRATKNATPTPFGIVYPPAYANNSFTFDHMLLRCLLAEPGDLSAEVRFLQSSGRRHEAVARRLELAEGEVHAEFGSLRVSARLVVSGPRVTLTVSNLTPVPEGIDRAEALRSSLISTHLIVQADGGRFVSPLESGLASVNTYPVLAGEADDSIVGAAIVLPDHPQLAPESLGSLFDATEIEEALMLHVQVLSDEERSAITDGDPLVREMIERAESADPDDVLALHGRVSLTPPAPSPGLPDPSIGERSACVDGVTYRTGMKVEIRPGPDSDIHARMLDGRTASVERIFVDFDGKVYLGVTIDGDPGQALLRETGRFLFFFTDEVVVLG
jgi:hypothetical protein